MSRFEAEPNGCGPVMRSIGPRNTLEADRVVSGRWRTHRRRHMVCRRGEVPLTFTPIASRIVVMHLLGGPLDGATIEAPRAVRSPELVEVSAGRRIHRYLVGRDGEYRYADPNAVAKAEAIRFAEWWDEHGAGDDAARETTWGAWVAAIDART